MRYVALPVITVLLGWPTLAVGQEVRQLRSPYPYPEPAWSPYVVGALIGVVTLLTLSVSNKPVGASSAYSDLAGMLGRLVAPNHVVVAPLGSDPVAES